VYFDKTSASTTDAGLGLVAQNAAAGTTVTVTAVAGASAAQPPANIENTVSLVHPVFIVAQEALAWVGFYNTKILMSPATATKDDPLAQRRTIGYKYFGKSVIKDQTRLLRLEVCSS
jgi:N4-gp56 family major capsid protein